MRFALLDRWAGGHDGPAVAVRELAAGLLEQGHEVILAYDQLRGREGVPGVSQVAIPELSRSRFQQDVISRLLATLSSFRPDAVLLECLDVPWFAPHIRAYAPVVWSLHTHSLTCPNWSRVLWRRDQLCERDFSPACAYHHFFGGCGRGAGVRTLLAGLLRCRAARRAVRSLDGLHALNDYMARTFARAGIPASRILVSQYPAPLYDEGAQWAEREPIAGLILFVGRLDREKGYAQLMQACAMVKAPHQLRLVGASELDGRESLRTPQAEGGNAEWVGAVTSRAELSAHFGQAAIVSVPSVWGDPSPLVRLEAMAHGRPVIAFDSGGVGSVIEHGKTGLLVPRMDVPALACAIDSLLTDPALARRMGRAARKKVEFEFSRERHVHDVVAFVQRLRLNNPRRV